MALLSRIPQIAVVGCGYWGKNLVRNFHELGALGALADAAPERLRQFEQLYKVVGRPLEVILKMPGIDAIVLAVPAEHHARLALQALEAGKHVFIEKPLALTMTDGQRIVAAAGAANRIVMVGHLLQYHPAFLKLKSLSSEGELGRI